MKNKVTNIVLFILGVLLVMPGVMALFTPETFTGRNGLDITGNISFYNDYRGLGALLLTGGLLTVVSVFRPFLRSIAIPFASLLYLGLGIGRIISIVVDGMPAEGLVKATIAEMILGGVALLLVVKKGKNQTGEQKATAS